MAVEPNPDRTYPVYFPADLDKPEPDRRAAMMRYQTSRLGVQIEAEQEEVREFAKSRLKEEKLSAADKLTLIEMAESTLSKVLAGWRNQPAGFALGDLTWEELWDIFWQIRPAQRLTEADRKKSASPAPSAGADSASPATPAAATGDASTRPASEPATTSPAGDATAAAA